MSRSRVVLPLPLRPTSTAWSRSSRANETPANSSWPPNDLETLSKETMVTGDQYTRTRARRRTGRRASAQSAAAPPAALARRPPGLRRRSRASLARQRLGGVGHGGHGLASGAASPGHMNIWRMLGRAGRVGAEVVLLRRGQRASRPRMPILPGAMLIATPTTLATTVPSARGDGRAGADVEVVGTRRVLDLKLGVAVADGLEVEGAVRGHVAAHGDVDVLGAFAARDARQAAARHGRGGQRRAGPRRPGGERSCAS